MDLCAAIVFRKTKDVKALLATEVDVNAACAGRLPLVVAASKGKTDVVRLLLDHGAEPGGVDAEGDTALVAACREGQAAVVALLLARGVDVNAPTPTNRLPLIEAVQGDSKGHGAVARQLIDAGAEVNVDQDGGRQTALMLAAAMSTVEMVTLLVEAGAEVNAIRPVGTALIRAVGSNEPGIVTLLVAHGADPTLCIPGDVDPQQAGVSALSMATSMKASAVLAALTGGAPEGPLPEVAVLWERLEGLLARAPAERRARLRPGAAPDAVRALEALVGQALTDDVRASYLRHDGQDAGASLVPAVGPFDAEYDLLPLASVGDTWRALKAQLDEGEFDDAWWSPAWLPFASDGAGDTLCVDLEQGPGGSRGRIIPVSHESARRDVVAPSLRAWLRDLLVQLEALAT